MKAIISLIIDFILFICTTLAAPVAEKMVTPLSYEADYIDLGSPLQSHYPDSTSCTPWDLLIYQDEILIACGDYDKNTGPTPVYSYNTQNGIWTKTGTVPDEQIEKLLIINDTVFAPGCDPRDDWEWGNIYKYDDDQWSVIRSIPGGIHQFDIIEYDGLMFVALGVTPGEYPIAVSDDDGTTFHQVPMYKDGQPLDTGIPQDQEITAIQVRAYDFFLINDQLFAYYCHYTNIEKKLEIYKYQDHAFHYYTDLPQNITAKRTTYRTINSKENFRGVQYFTTGNLYMTYDFKNATEITLRENTAVTDLKVINGRLYALLITPEQDGTFRTSVWYTNGDEPDEFRELFYFYHPCPAHSFDYNGESFYFGMGHGIMKNDCKHCGAVLSISHKLP